MFKRFLIGVLAVVAASASLRAQMRLDNEPLRPGAEAWNMVRYGEVEPSLYTGTVAVSIPIYHYKDSDFDVPISLNYASNGCVPNVRSGMLGPDWSLSAGGCIAREIRGIPDNRNIGGYHGFHDAYDHSFEMDSVKVVWYNSEIPDHASCLYVTGNTIPYYDAEPDIYHFNVPGYSGSFHLDYNHGIRILTSNTNRAELRVEVITESYYMASDYFKELKITTGDGYIYHFYGTNGHDGNNVEEGQTIPSTLNTPDTTKREALKWNLSKIEAPNGRTVTYHYRRLSEMKSLRPYTYIGSTTTCFAGAITSNPNQPVNAMEYRRGSILDWIDVDGEKIVSFDYMTDVSEKQQLTGTTGILDSNNIRLAGIKIWAYNKIVKESRMSYTNTGNSPSGVLFLESVYVEGEGTYSMTYDHPENYPPLGITSVDHWGYYNGLTGSNYLDVTDFNYQTKDESFKANNCRIPNSNYAKTGMLTRITYPSGGYSVFTYEPHMYSCAMVRASTTYFEPQLIDMLYTDLECGGLRIRKVCHYDSDGTELTSKEYIYASLMDHGLGSGILVYMPRYKAAYELQYKNLGVDGIEVGSFKSNNLTKYSDTHIEYASVIEVNADGSFVQYNFTTSRDYPDEIRRFGGMDYQGTNASFQVKNKLDMDLINKVIMQATSLQAVRGKLLSKTVYDSEGGIVMCESTEYLTDSVYCAGAYIRQYEHLLATMNIPAEFIGRIDVSRSTTTSFFADGNRMISTSRTYNYNGRRQIASITETDSKGKTLIKSFVYVTDAQKDSVEVAMVSANVISWPTSERIYYDGVLTGEKIYYFCRPDPSKTMLFRIGKVREKDVTTNTWYTTEYSYDKNGNLLEIKKPDNRRTCYLWGYGGMYPIAVIDGCSLAQIESISVFSSIEDGPFEGGLSASAETALRNGVPVDAEVCTYEFEPLVGPVRVTGPDGRKEVYDYNNAGKLMRVYDNGMHLRESYYYSPENK